jgi:hypothetical protein
MNYFSVIVILMGLFTFSSTEAATLYIDPGIATIFRGDAITTAVRVMPDQEAGECINAGDIVITYPEWIQPVDVSIGKSIFSVWVQAPVIDKENRTISFAGGIPNGYCGRVQGDPSLTNIIAEVVFRSPGFQIGASNVGDQAEINFSPLTQLYLNDGAGTKAELRTISSTITLEKGPGNLIVDDWRAQVQADDIPPELFSISLERDPIAFSGKYFIVFTTSDKQTGISHYEVMEEPLADGSRFSWGEADAPWIKAQSPYVLKDQSLNSTIRVKALDKAGNEYIATLIPDESLRATSPAEIKTYIVIGMVVFVFLILLILTIVFIKRRAKKSVIDNQEVI